MVEVVFCAVAIWFGVLYIGMGYAWDSHCVHVERHAKRAAHDATPVSGKPSRVMLWPINMVTAIFARFYDDDEG